MYDQPENQVMEFVRAPGMKGGERQDNKIHNLLHGTTKEQSADQRMFLQKSEPTACTVVNRGRRASDKEVESDTENVGADSSVKSTSSKQTAGNHERNVPSEEDAGLSQVYSPGDQAASEDCQQRAAMFLLSKC